MHFQPIQFGGRIRKLRREHHLTQERLAVMLNISVEHLRKIELGKRGISRARRRTSWRTLRTALCGSLSPTASTRI